MQDARGRGQILVLPAGAFDRRAKLETVGAPWIFDGARPRPRRPPPALDEHGDEIRRELDGAAGREGRSMRRR